MTTNPWKIGDVDVIGRKVLRIDPILGDPDFGEGYECGAKRAVLRPAGVTSINEPDPALVAELELLLDQARTGELRGLLFTAYRQGTVDHRYGSAGAYSLADFALGVKLMELELDSIVSRGQTDDGT